MVRGWMAKAAVSAVAAVAVGLMGCQSSGTTATNGSSGTGSEFDQGPVGSDTGSGMTSESSLASVYFDYDRYHLREDAKRTLRADAESIQSNTGWDTVTIEGHCDERGSEEYNLALGERRANGVKRYLMDLGVPSSRMRTVSFGEAKAAVMGHDESAWRYNRRADFKVSTR